MRFRTVQDILEWTRTFHHHLGEAYRELSESSTRERARMLLDYLADHEQALETAIEHYETDAADRLLRTWYQGTRDIPLPKTLEAAREALRDSDTTAIMLKSIEFHDLLIGIYRELVDQAPTDDARALFNSLAEMENHEKMRMVRDAMRFEDI